MFVRLVRSSIRTAGVASSLLAGNKRTVDTRGMMTSPLRISTALIVGHADNPDPGLGTTITVCPLRVPTRVRPEDAESTTLPAFLLSVMADNHVSLEDDDVLVVTSKLASLFEGRTVPLSEIRAGRKARWLGRIFGKDPRKLQLLMEEGRVLLVVPMKRITRIPSVWRQLLDLSPNPAAMRTGFDSTNAFTFITRKHAAYMDEAGIDHANAPQGCVSLLPADPCRTADHLRADLARMTGRSVAVVVTDTTTTIGRLGCRDIAVGYAGIEPVRAGMFRDDLLGVPRSGGTEIVIDSITAIAGLAMGESDNLCPLAVVRGVAYPIPSTQQRPTMEALAWPADANVRMAAWSLLATVWFRIVNAFTFSRWPKPTGRTFDSHRRNDDDSTRSANADGSDGDVS